LSVEELGFNGVKAEVLEKFLVDLLKKGRSLILELRKTGSVSGRD
jgi:hypothetical protein